jgi:predicted dienelactone hydrolase
MNTPHQLGCHGMQLMDPVQKLAIPLICFYPTQQTPQGRAFGPFNMEAAMDAPPAGTGLPLVLLSHGNGGTLWAYRDLAAHLARNGFAVAMPEHLGNSRSDNSLAGTAANLANRPRHLCLAIEATLADPLLGAHLAPERGVGLIGHSIGGYSALAAAGGQPWTGPQESGGRPSGRVEVAHDARIRALVLLAPATPWFMPAGALAQVHAPILMFSGSHDTITPSWHADIVKQGVADPAKVKHHTVAGAGHFSFMSPFPAAMARPDFAPSQDPPGFDRAALQPVLQTQVLEFLRAPTLAPGG